MFIKITNNRIIYNSGFKTKEVLFSEITKITRNSFGDIFIYKNNKKIVALPKEMEDITEKFQCNDNK